jgi:hypothetical protein
MNLCSCGFFGDPRRTCTCAAKAVVRYQPVWTRPSRVLNLRSSRLIIGKPDLAGERQAELYIWEVLDDQRIFGNLDTVDI